MIGGLLALGGCNAVPPVPADGPFVVEGVGPTATYIYPAEIQKDLARRVGSGCASGYDVLNLETRRNSGRMGASLIRYRAVVQCRRV